MSDKIKIFFQKLIHFLTIGIWSVDTQKSGRSKAFFYTGIKSFMLAYRNLDWGLVNTKAAALTYSTLLSIVPLLAVLFAIARGFGFQNIVESELFGYFEGQKDVLDKAMSFIDNSLEYAQSGVFLGIGLVLLLYTVMNLLGSVESNFNSIWRIKKDRSYYRQFTDYMALVLIAPVLLVCNAGFSLILNSSAETRVIGLVITPFIEILPFLITIALFTFIYLYIPNTKVKFSSAFFAGVVAGVIFQLFQQLYIGGQIWISKYNAIYGSFAALPLLLLWMQVSWLIVLIGVEISFSNQNVKKFSYEKETKNISRRYKDFVILLISTIIVKRFEHGDKPYTANDISERFKIPTRVTSDVLEILLNLNIIRETPSDENMVPAYVPALDINRISVGFLFEKVDSYGTEDFFTIDIKGEFKEEWGVIEDIRNTIYEKEESLLVKDL